MELNIHEKLITTNLSSMMSSLPKEIVNIEIIPKIDPPSLLVLRHTLLSKTQYELTNLKNKDKKYLYNYSPEFFELFLDIINIHDICREATKAINLELLKWARSKDYPWDGYVLDLAASSGNLEILKWVHRNGCPSSTDLCRCAAFYGHSEILEWLVSKGEVLSKYIDRTAARGGHFHILKWIRGKTKYGSWDNNTCTDSLRSRSKKR